MPTKKPSLFDVTGKEPPREKLPTLKQWLKQAGEITYPIQQRIQVIWFPGNWDNYSIETTDLRASISSNHPLYSVLENSVVKVFSDAESAILLGILNSEGEISFLESNFYGVYKPIGQAGYKFQPTDGAN